MKSVRHFDVMILVLKIEHRSLSYMDIIMSEIPYVSHVKTDPVVMSDCYCFETMPCDFLFFLNIKEVFLILHFNIKQKMFSETLRIYVLCINQIMLKFLLIYPNHLQFQNRSLLILSISENLAITSIVRYYNYCNCIVALILHVLVLF